MTNPSGNLRFAAAAAAADSDDDGDALEEEEEKEEVDGEEGEGEELEEMEESRDGEEEEHVAEVEEEDDEVEEEVEDGDDEDEEYEEVEEEEEDEEVQGEEVMEEDGDDEEEEIEEVGLVEEAEEEKGEGGDEAEVQEVEEEGVGEDIEEEIEEVLMEVDEVRQSKGEEEAGADSAAAVIPLLDTIDAYKMVKSGECDKDVKLVSCPTVDDNAEKLHAQDPSIMVSKSKCINDTSVGNVSSAFVAKGIPFEEDGFLMPIVGETCKGHHLEKENQKEGSKLGKNNHLETYRSHHSLGCDPIESVKDHKIDMTMEVGVMSDSKIVKYDVAEQVELPQHGRTDSPISVDSSLRCGHNSLRRPRSSSPSGNHDKMNKKPAMICQFYAKGWCIKGKLCKFLHQKDENVIADQQAKEDKAGISMTRDSLGSKGSEEMVEESRIISPSLVNSNKAGSSECNSLLRRAFVPTYGTGSHTSHQFDDHYRGAHQTRDAFSHEYSHHSGNYSSDSRQYQNSNKLLVYGSTEDIDGRCGHRKFPHQVIHSLLGSTPSAECIEGHTSLDFDKGYYCSQSASLTRNSSPYKSLAHHNFPIPGDPLPWQKTKTEYDAWEPSQPFRPSFPLVTSNISSPQSQYDPIIDSIEPTSTGGLSLQISLPATTNNILHGSGNTFSQTCEGTLANNTSLHDSNVFGAVVISESSKLKGENYILNDEKVLKQDHLMERSNSKEAKAGGALRNPLEQSRKSKESKAYKAFHASLVDFVKDLLKPWWREGRLSKDAHKSIVKKSAEKVLSALPSHQIPSTSETINQYLTSSRPKLLKLVEGYVEKYINS